MSIRQKKKVVLTEPTENRSFSPFPVFPGNQKQIEIIPVLNKNALCFQNIAKDERNRSKIVRIPRKI